MTDRLADVALRLVAPRTGVTLPAGDSLESLDTAILPNGALVVINENTSLYRLDKTSAAAPTTQEIIAPGSGPGRWFRVLGPASPFTVISTLADLPDADGGGVRRLAPGAYAWEGDVEIPAGESVGVDGAGPVVIYGTGGVVRRDGVSAAVLITLDQDVDVALIGLNVQAANALSAIDWDGNNLNSLAQMIGCKVFGGVYNVRTLNDAQAHITGCHLTNAFANVGHFGQHTSINGGFLRNSDRGIEVAAPAFGDHVDATGTFFRNMNRGVALAAANCGTAQFANCHFDNMNAAIEALVAPGNATLHMHSCTCESFAIGVDLTAGIPNWGCDIVGNGFLFPASVFVGFTAATATVKLRANHNGLGYESESALTP